MAKRPKKKMTETTTANKRTLVEKIALTEALLAKYKQQLVTESILNNIEAGDKVEFTYGRAESKRTIAGTVLAVADTETGKMAAVQAGEGLDIKTYKVRVQDITSNATAAERDAAAPAGEADPLNAE